MGQGIMKLVLGAGRRILWRKASRAEEQCVLGPRNRLRQKGGRTDQRCNFREIPSA